MNSTNLIVDFVAVSIAALIGGLGAQRLRLPPIVGYIVGGVAIRPVLPSARTDLSGIETMANIGVALLMFALGTEFSLTRLRTVGRVAVLGGSAQILATIAVGTILGFALGFDLLRALYWGCLISLSSTMVVLKLLQRRGELDTPAGHIAVGILIVQDLAVVPMMVVLPALAGVGADTMPALGLALFKAAALLIAVYFLGTKLVPWLLHQVALGASRELLPLAVIAIGLGMAMGSYSLGLSIAFGAFLAGLVVSETEFEYQILAEVRPLRDVFGSLFFVSVGMLVEPQFLLAEAPLIIALALAVAVTKLLIGGAVPLVFGYPGRVALPVGLALLQIGEFSFVLAQQGVVAGIIPNTLYSLTLSVSLVTILLTPLALWASPALTRALSGFPPVRRLFVPSPVVHGGGLDSGSRRHAVILGYGRVGRELAGALEERGFTWLAVDIDLRVVRELRKRNLPAIYGDAAELEVLMHVGLDRAELLAVALPDVGSAERAVRRAREMNPDIPIIARARERSELSRLITAGAEEIVHPEFEASLEFIRFALRRYGVSGIEVQHLLSGRRLGYYSRTEQS